MTTVKRRLTRWYRIASARVSVLGGLALRDDLSIADADLLFMPEDSDDQAHQIASAGDFNNDEIPTSSLERHTMTAMDEMLEKSMSILAVVYQNLVSSPHNLRSGTVVRRPAWTTGWICT